MKKIMITAVICSLVIIGGTAFAASGRTGASAWKEPNLSAPGYGLSNPGEPNPVGHTCFTSFQPTGWDLFEASWLIGHEVSGMDDSYLGQISNLVVDQSNGRIALVILSDVPGFGAKSVAVPYRSLVRIGLETFQISLPYQIAGFYETDQYHREMSASVVPSVIDSTWTDFVYRNYGLTPYWEEKGEQPVMELYKSSILMGAEVRSPERENIARVDDLVINSSDGRIIFLSLGHVAGRGDSLEAVPFSILSKSEGNIFALNVAKEKLAIAPTFNESEDINNPKWAENDYRFFSVQPCWTEMGSGESK